MSEHRRRVPGGGIIGVKVGKTARICLTPRLSGVGGPSSFQEKLASGLRRLGFEVSYDLDKPAAAVLVVGGTRNLPGLWQARQRGERIIQRLDGMNWMHKVRRTGVRHYIRSEYGNAILAIIRGRLADGIIYQSRFSQEWWERVRGPVPAKAQVVYNGVDLDVYHPAGQNDLPEEVYRVLLVEGRLGGGYEVGLETAIRLGERLNQNLDRPVEVQVVGRVNQELIDAWVTRAAISVRFTGPVRREQIPDLDRSAHVLFSADLNPACPNSVIEALACGLPVVSYDTGAICELVSGDAGRVVPYGGNPWRLDPPDQNTLASAAAEIIMEQKRFRAGARARAEEAFDLQRMVESYLEVMLPA